MLAVIDYSREDSRPIPSAYPVLDPEYSHCFENMAEASCDLHWEIIWDDLCGEIEEIEVQREIWAEWQAEVAFDLAIAKAEEDAAMEKYVESRFWDSGIETVE